MVPDCRVLTWNVWWRFGDWAARQPLIADVIGSVDADMIALQEVWTHGEANQLEQLSVASGLDHAAFSSSRTPRRWRERIAGQPEDLTCGIAVLSRWPIADIVDRALPAGVWPSQGHTSLGVVVDHPRGRLPVVVTHLDSHPARSSLRVEQLEAVAALTRDMMHSAGPSRLSPIVCGDMNAEPDSDEIRRFGGVLTAPFIEDLSFLDAWRVAGPDDDPGWTWRKDNPNVDAGNPNARIDYIFTGLAGRVIAVQLAGAENRLQWPSDHAAVVADIRP
jgi:endonuclease/exonuclease/phosphatase family metal-dependent hydrolase